MFSVRNLSPNSEPWLGRNPIARSGVQPAGSGISCTENNFSIRYGNGSFIITFYTVTVFFAAVDDQIWTLITLCMLSCHLNRVCVNKKKVMGLRVSHCIGRKVHMVWQVQCSWSVFYIQCELHKCPNSLCTDKSCRKYLIFGFRSKRGSYCTVRDYVRLDCSSHF